MNRIKEYFKENIFSKQSLKLYFQNNLDVYQIAIKEYQKYKDKYGFFYFVKFYLNDSLEKKCIVCGTQLTCNQIKKHAVYCSHQCAFGNGEMQRRSLRLYGVKNPFQKKQFKEKAKQTCLQKYGTEYASQSSQIKNLITEKLNNKTQEENLQTSQKRKQTNLRKYGVEHFLQNETIRQKIKQTNLQKYGVENPFQNQQIKQKINQTNLQKYGVQHYSELNQFKEKTKKTNLQKFGCQSPINNQQIKQKIKQTNLQKYGCQNVFQNQQIKQKIKQTNLQKFGVEYPICLSEILQKQHQTNLEKYGAKTYKQSLEFKINSFNCFIDRIKDYVIPLFDINNYNGYQENYKWKCVKCGNQFQQNIHVNEIKGRWLYIPRCLNCYPYLSGYSNAQKQVLQFVKSIYNGEIKDNDREVIKPFELDIYLPDYNFAIQYNGLIWHSDKYNNPFNILNKTQLCRNKQIRLIHIFEDEWIYKQQIVKDRIKSMLNIYDHKIFARKCQIKEISSKQKNQFLELNHLQGSDNSKIKLGLFYQNQLISVMTFGKPRFNKKYEYELIRFCNKLGYKIIGGASKLLTYFQKNYHPKSLISYADKRYSNGELYKCLNFAFVGVSNPNYSWVNNCNRISRYRSQKGVLKQLLGEQNFKQELSESQNMYKNGYNRIYDCGNLIFGKTY